MKDPECLPGSEDQFYGRRRGKKLRPHRAELVDTLLPQLAIPDLPDSPTCLDPRGLFGHAVSAVWLEIGFGAGEHLAAQAAARPEIGFIGAEPYINGVATLLAAIDRQGLRNIRILADDVRPFLARLSPGSLDRVFILFPDPWPKSRHHRRRLVCRPVLDALARAMAEGGELRLATDHMGYARWMLTDLARHPAFEWTARRPCDWRDRPGDWPATRYEAKARAAGDPPVFFRMVRRGTA